MAGEEASEESDDDELHATCESKQGCSKCAIEEGCGWCGDGADGLCQLTEASCKFQFIEAHDDCPAVGANVVLRNISGFLGAMLAVAVLLNVLNRCQNRRRSNKLKKSIFTLPCYVHPSREKRAAALREARSRFGVPLDPARDVEEQLSDGECSDQGAATMPSCSICLSAYENDEVIKVLPCGHEFHSECLNSWLEVKAMCPLCKTHAFSNGRDARRRKGRGRVRIESSSSPRRSSREVWRVLHTRAWLRQTASTSQDPDACTEEAREIGALASCPCGSPRNEVCEEGCTAGVQEAIEVKEEISTTRSTNLRELANLGASDVAVILENGHATPPVHHEADRAPGSMDSLPTASHYEDNEAGEALSRSLPFASAKEPQGVAAGKGIQGSATDAEFGFEALRAQFSMSQFYPRSKHQRDDRAVET